MVKSLSGRKIAFIPDVQLRYPNLCLEEKDENKSIGIG
jgi:hypothetical protein